jgi:hypothetical protein
VKPWMLFKFNLEISKFRSKFPSPVL